MTGKDKKPDIEAALAALREGFAKKLPGKIQEIKQSWGALKSQSDDDELFHVLHLQVHSLSGTGSTYSFASLASCAKQIELALQSLPEKRAERLPISVIESLLAKLEDAAQLETSQQVSHLQKDDYFPDDVVEEDTLRNNLVYLVDDDLAYCCIMKAQIEAFGYEVMAFSELAEFDKAMSEREPAVVIMDIMLGDQPTGGIDHITQFNIGRELPLQTVFITGTSDILTRLSAVRANGQAYFTKPVMVEQLIDTLDRLTRKSIQDPYRILIVEDSKEQSEYIALTLQQVGMQTREVNGPLELLSVLSEESADLILMDLYMPECTGFELSQVVRQMDDYVSIPIVFLSAEHDLDKKLGAMSQGGDDFLTKPIEPWHLISAVKSRALRGRQLRKLTEVDGLTGLLNHGTCKERLEAELSSARRDGRPLSLAMLDIDHFKKVNDTYGHPAGDRVLKSLAAMFKQRLRKYDIIGRYGGEEFIVILPSTDAPTAKMVIDTVRERFAEISHRGDDNEFSCHFSCGIASFPQIDNSAALCEEADKALYEAKESGRNRVVCAESSLQSLSGRTFMAQPRLTG